MTNLYRLIDTIGGLEEKLSDFIHEGSIRAMIKIYRTSKDWDVKLKTLQFWAKMLETETDMQTDVANQLHEGGAPITMASDMVTFARIQDERQESYLDNLMQVMYHLAKLKIVFEAFTANEFIVAVVDQVNSGNQNLKI